MDSSEPTTPSTGDRAGASSDVPNVAIPTTQIPRSGWWQILRRSIKQIGRDGVTDRAAALTYFGVLAIFPAVLVLVSILGLVGPDTAQNFLDSVKSIAPGGVTSFLSGVIDQVQGKAAAAGAAAVVGIVIALWSASGYIAAFMRAANAVYGVREGRPFWKTIPVRVLTTLLVVVLLIACVVIVAVTGPIADKIGSSIGVGDALQWVWAIAKWPVLVIIVALLFSLLYGATPNVKYGRFRLLTAGGALAVVIWLLVSGLFGLYVSFSGSYNKTYGSLATVIVFLVWLWISNIAILLGLEFDAEIQHEKAIRAGAPADLEPFVRVRDTRTMDDKDRRQVEASAAVLAERGEPEVAPNRADGRVSGGDGPRRARPTTGEDANPWVTGTGSSADVPDPAPVSGTSGTSGTSGASGIDGDDPGRPPADDRP